MQKSRQGFRTTALGLCLSLGLTQIALPLSALANGVTKGKAYGSSNTASGIAAPIGTITSSGIVSINGRNASGQQAVWNGELLQAPADAAASVTLAALGNLKLTSSALVRVSAAGNANGRTLVAAVYEGEAEIALAPNATAYLEAAGQAWIVAGNTSLKLAVKSGEATLHTLRGTASRLGAWSLNLPSFNATANSDEVKETDAQTAERAALLRSIKLVTQRTGIEGTQAVHLVANARAAMIGMIESADTLWLNGRATRRQELLWDGEIVQASDNAEARAALANFGTVKLAQGSRAKLSTAAVAGAERSASGAAAFRPVARPCRRGNQHLSCLPAVGSAGRCALPPVPARRERSPRRSDRTAAR